MVHSNVSEDSDKNHGKFYSEWQVIRQRFEMVPCECKLILLSVHQPAG
jgi:hypothetical protein